MKIHRVSFNLQYLPFLSLLGKGVNEHAATSHKTADCTCDIISYVPTVNTVNRRDIYACTLLHYQLIYNLDK